MIHAVIFDSLNLTTVNINTLITVNNAIEVARSSLLQQLSFAYSKDGGQHEKVGALKSSGKPFDSTLLVHNKQCATKTNKKTPFRAQWPPKFTQNILGNKKIDLNARLIVFGVKISFPR